MPQTDVEVSVDVGVGATGGQVAAQVEGVPPRISLDGVDQRAQHRAWTVGSEGMASIQPCAFTYAVCGCSGAESPVRVQRDYVPPDQTPNHCSAPHSSNRSTSTNPSFVARRTEGSLAVCVQSTTDSLGSSLANHSRTAAQASAA